MVYLNRLPLVRTVCRANVNTVTDISFKNFRVGVHLLGLKVPEKAAASVLRATELCSGGFSRPALT